MRRKPGVLSSNWGSLRPLRKETNIGFRRSHTYVICSCVAKRVRVKEWNTEMTAVTYKAPCLSMDPA